MGAQVYSDLALLNLLGLHWLITMGKGGIASSTRSSASGGGIARSTRGGIASSSRSGIASSSRSGIASSTRGVSSSSRVQSSIGRDRPWERKSESRFERSDSSFSKGKGKGKGKKGKGKGKFRAAALKSEFWVRKK